MGLASSRIGRLTVAGAALTLLWAGFAYDVSRPDDFRSYRRTLLQVAESAHDAAQTGRLVAEQQLAGRVTGGFARTAFDDAAKALAGAQQKFAGEGPPDAESRALRDRLSPLLAAEVVTLGDTAEAADDRRLRSGADALGSLAQRLDDFITAQQS
jgi:hypothetical protein